MHTSFQQVINRAEVGAVPIEPKSQAENPGCSRLKPPDYGWVLDVCFPTAARQNAQRFLFALAMIFAAWITSGCDYFVPNVIEHGDSHSYEAGLHTTSGFKNGAVPEGHLIHASTEPSVQPLNALGMPVPSLESNPRTSRLHDVRPPLFAMQLQDATISGLPIGLFSDQTYLMLRDGSITGIVNELVQRQGILEERFQPIHPTELSKNLHQEFGRRYSIKNEPPYVVVAEANNLPKWSQRFRTVLQSFQLYCSTHSIPSRAFEFPLVAIVFATHKEFLQYAASEQAKLPANCLGYYSQKSNRIVLFEMGDAFAEDTLETICHEAIHQLAFNSGLHQRLSGTPSWLGEGFATMFEAPTLSGLSKRDGRSLWPAARKNDWQQLAKKPELISKLVVQLVESDASFERDAPNAYCVSWGMVLYLSHRRSAQFRRYMEKIASLAPYEEYKNKDRRRDFERCFETDAKMISKSIVSFINELD